MQGTVLWILTTETREERMHRREIRGILFGARTDDESILRTQAARHCAARLHSTRCSTVGGGRARAGRYRGLTPLRARGSASRSPAGGAKEYEAALLSVGDRRPVVSS